MIRNLFLLLLLPTASLPAGPTARVEDPAPGNTFDSYWYSGAEIARYELTQVQYGEARTGDGVLIFVTEPFLPEEQVKPDTAGGPAVPILKLNRTRNFLTGIYPYSLMTSVFAPINRESHPRALKATTSAQDWCGQSWVQLNRRGDDYEAEVRSYFESKGDQDFPLQSPEAWLEEDLLLQIRIDPGNLPTGDLMVVPSGFFQRLRHTLPLPVAARASLSKEGELTTYTVEWPRLDREVSFDFDSAFPHRIRFFRETLQGRDEVTGALTHLKILPYWKLNSKEHLRFRDELGLGR